MSLDYLDGNLGIVMNKQHSLWENHWYFGSQCGFLSTEPKEDSSLFISSPHLSTMYNKWKANVRSSAVKSLSE